MCVMCEVDSDCTHAKTPFLIVWTIVSAGVLLIVPLVTVGLGLCAAIHHVSYDCFSRNETVVGQACKETGYSALTSFAQPFPGHRGVRKKSALWISTARVSSTCFDDQGVSRLHRVPNCSSVMLAACRPFFSFLLPPLSSRHRALRAGLSSPIFI